MRVLLTRRLAPWSVAAAILAAVAACRMAPPQPQAIDRLRPCSAREGLTDAYCGSLTVFENRQTRTGRTIDLQIVVLPAAASNALSDPVFFLAGGPGQGAAKMARDVRTMFRRLQDRRDIVLIDQRGTGHSRPLECPVDDDSLQSLNESDDQALARLRVCLNGLDADPRFYTTTIAMDDLDDVRAYLGYETINLYGGSYGTRAALSYLRQHEGRVRTVVLDGVAPTDMTLPLFLGRDAQRALDRLLADCAADAACHGRYPGLAGRLEALFQRLERSPSRVRLVHPRTGVAEAVTVDARFVANVLTGALYSPLVASMLPEIIARADAGDFQGMLALGMMGEAAEPNMSVGMQLSVLCAEDYPRVTREEVAREAAGSAFARYLLVSRMRACEFWPKGDVAPAYYEPVTSAVPTLVLSGDLDPVTPPSWGQRVADHLSRSRHLVAPGTGHGVIGTGCGATLIRDFINRASAESLDTSCLSGLQRPPFFVTPAGPDPSAGRSPSS